MNLPFSFKQKIKIALLLFCIMLCTIVIRFLEDKTLKNMGKTFASMYNDRLIPATDLFQISEHMIAKGRIVDAYLHQDHKQPGITKLTIRKYDLKIDSLLDKYQSTFLVASEKDNLKVLKRLINEHTEIENAVLANYNQRANPIKMADHKKQLDLSYGNIFKILSDLTKIQSEVGEKLSLESQRLIGGSKLYSMLQFVLVICIGVLIVSIIFTANLIKIKPENFHLN